MPSERYTFSSIRFSVALSLFRAQNNLSINAASEILGITNNTLISWEKERTTPSIEDLCRASNWMGLEPGYFLVPERD